ncbi:MAG: hypothetical protein ACFFC7_00255 [Candidatus Hermodarchaeota archaeon]
MQFRQIYSILILAVIILCLTSLVNQVSATKDLICYRVSDKEQIDLDEEVKITLTIRNTVLLVPIKNVTIEQTFPELLEIVNSTAGLESNPENKIEYTYPLIEIDEIVVFWTILRPNMSHPELSDTEQPVDKSISIDEATINFLYLDNSKGTEIKTESSLELTIFQSDDIDGTATYTKPPTGTIDIGIETSYIIGYGLIVVFFVVAAVITIKRR